MQYSNIYDCLDAKKRGGYISDKRGGLLCIKFFISLILEITLFSDTLSRATEVFYFYFFCLVIGTGKRNFSFSFSGSRIRILSAGSFSWTLASLDPDFKTLFSWSFSPFPSSGIGFFLLGSFFVLGLREPDLFSLQFLTFS